MRELSTILAGLSEVSKIRVLVSQSRAYITYAGSQEYFFLICQYDKLYRKLMHLFPKKGNLRKLNLER
jgi:hypothetical protein